MTRPVSVVVVSHGRPDALMRCLTGIGQLDYDPFEVIVVACSAGSTAVAARQDARFIKLATFDAPNVSAARNLGIAAAAGEVVAFIDDDAVPEPLWLRHLTAPFDQGSVAAAGGFVLGRNGISFQWMARSVGPDGETHPLTLESDSPAVLRPPQPDRAIKTEGTNMALRRDVIAAMGGFDPAFRFFLDETDVNMRLARAGHATAIVPLAQVHHGFAESPRRAPDRSPRDLFEIGASQAVFLRKHCSEPKRKAAWKAFRAAQRRRCLTFLQRGPLGADDVARLMRRLDLGRKDGETRSIDRPPELPRAAAGLLPYPGRSGARRVTLSGPPWAATRLRATAAQDVANGAIVSLFLFSPTPLRHNVTFTQGGVWEQRGGTFGRSLRDGPRLHLTHRRRRTRTETARIAPVRGGPEPEK